MSVAGREAREPARNGNASEDVSPTAEATSADRAPRPAREGSRARRRGRGRTKPQADTRRNQTRGASNEEPLYGALDLGTNNCRLLIARRTREGFKVVDAYSRIVRLGEGLTARGSLSDAAMDRSVEALRICADKMTRRGVARSRLIATQACRIASNGADFIARVKAETGLSLEIVSNEDEARLAVAGCAPLLDRECASALVFDIGGGSTELIWVSMEQPDPDRPKPRFRPRIEDWTSLACGVVTLAERHGGVEVPGEVYERMVDEVTDRIAPFVARLREARAGLDGGFHLLGTSGTVTTIAGVHLGLPRYDRNRVDGIWISPGDVDSVTRDLLAMTYDARAAHPCVGRERADLVLAGCAIFEAIARAWPAERLRVADRGLREGILLSLMEADINRSRRRRRRRRRGQKPASQTAETSI
ncbi:MAG: Ppx/GppA phosphatase family protein [Parvibaculum sp.]|uniref:Ppx/GppA phosphatase family protein n=1 Tax=Parvibaculum sp. TaxID=2024848 RepID=UPI0028492C99|nr:Ppx/GppA phosphatase family protein [Parvibaculum sp.]MDR3500903.1 Ppx/GppA phosphatase family protein [Parvibaculum sp.]